jgi:hypothetical protein
MATVYTIPDERVVALIEGARYARRQTMDLDVMMTYCKHGHIRYLQVDALNGEWLGVDLEVPFHVRSCTVSSNAPHIMRWRDVADFEAVVVPQLVYASNG